MTITTPSSSEHLPHLSLYAELKPKIGFKNGDLVELEIAIRGKYPTSVSVADEPTYRYYLFAGGFEVLPFELPEVFRNVGFYNEDIERHDPLSAEIFQPIHRPIEGRSDLVTQRTHKLRVLGRPGIGLELRLILFYKASYVCNMWWGYRENPDGSYEYVENFYSKK